MKHQNSKKPTFQKVKSWAIEKVKKIDRNSDESGKSPLKKENTRKKLRPKNSQSKSFVKLFSVTLISEQAEQTARRTHTHRTDGKKRHISHAGKLLRRLFSENIVHLPNVRKTLPRIRDEQDLKPPRKFVFLKNFFIVMF